VIFFNFKSFMKQILIATALLAASFGVQAQELKGNAEAGKAKNAACIGCHGIPGYKASFPSVYSAPMIAGQNAKYIENALTAYKAGERKHPTMRATAASLSAQDMADLAAYYANLK
jgi:cytochrome c553